MKVLLLTARPELEVNRRLEAEAHARGVEARTVNACRVNATLAPAPALWLDGEDLLERPPDAVLARVGNWRPESLLAALEVAIAAGAVTPNQPAAIREGRDHWLTIRRLAAAGLPVAATMAGADPEELASAACSRLGLPVVVKLRRSRMGVGVIRCSTRDHLESVLDSLWRLGDEIVVQRLVQGAGTSLRLLVVGERVAAAARFFAGEGEWRSNAARGGRAESFVPDARQTRLALAAARCLGLGVCGVDLLPGDAGTLVCEVNPTPGFRHLEEASGVNVAGAIVDHLLEKYSRA